VSTPSNRSGEAVVLAGDQLRLYERLVDRDDLGRLAEMYLGALVVLEQTANPDRSAQACHSLRDLMEKIAYLGHGDKRRERMRQKAEPLKEAWNRHRELVGEVTDHNNGDPIGPSMLLVIAAVHEFVAWDERNLMSRKEQAQRVLEHLSVSGFVVPAAQQRENVRAWMELRDFFDDKGHHGSTTIEEVRARIGELERFLLALWMPEPTSDFPELDAITGKAGDDAV
jgi:hypothetical protein